MIFIQQGGRNRHEHICESLELFADAGDAGVQGEGSRARARQARAPGARPSRRRMARKQFMPAPSDEEIAEVRAYGRTITEPGRPQGQGAGLAIPTENPAK